MTEDIGTPVSGLAFDEACSAIRRELKSRAATVKMMIMHPALTQGKLDAHDSNEMKANIMLAYRHLEDATMRLGKAIQAFDGGASVYDK